MNREAEISKRIANMWLKDGDILYSILHGIPHFYQVVSSGEDYRVDVREIGIRIAGEDVVVPVKGRFIGPALRVSTSAGGEIRISTNNYAMLWDGHSVLVGEEYRMVASRKTAVSDLTPQQIARLSGDLARIAKEPVEVEWIKGAIYAFPQTELGMYRIWDKYGARLHKGYSSNFGKWYVTIAE